MKKKAAVWISCLAVGGVLLTGCEKGVSNTALELQEGVLTWETAEAAAAYEVDLGGGGRSVAGTKFDMVSACEQEGEFTVTVRSVDEKGQRKDIASMEVAAVMLEEPVIAVTGSGEELYFEWAPVEGAVSYAYDAHDGNGLQIAEAEEDGKYRVPVTNQTKQMIRVVANGTSEGNKILVSAESVYTYRSDNIFDMSLLAKYPAVYTGDGELQGVCSVGSTLKKGVYDLEVTMYVMNSDGESVTGNGSWGRRIIDQTGKNFWFCEKEMDGYPGSGDTIPDAAEAVVYPMSLKVDRGGNVLIPVYDFELGEKVVVADIVYNGESVLNEEGGKANPVEEVEKFDIETLDDYLVVYRSPGGYYTEETKEDFEVKVPVNLSDGTHTVSVTYYVCNASGDMIEGNGAWGRRIAGADIGGPFAWLNEYDIDAGNTAAEIPYPTQSQTSKFTVEVKNGTFVLKALDFDAGDLLIISDVKTATAPSGNGIFVSEGELSETFKVSTTLTGIPRHTDVALSVTYKVYDIFGNQVSGNGSWGRRMYVGGEWIWLCEDDIEDHPEAKGTAPKAEQEITQELFFYEINKFGVITLDMYDFAAGDVVEITSIKYNGEEVLVK